jgi:excisionase family DNA binding protein
MIRVDRDRSTQIYPHSARGSSVVVPAVTRSARLPDRPLSLGPASRLLGVDPDTLRRWADEGRIEAFTTSGGHRRFARATLERILEARRHDATVRLANLGATRDRLSRAYRRGYSSETGVSGVRAAIPEADREPFRDGGRELVAALLSHLDAEDDLARDDAEETATALTDALARRLAEADISLADSVSLFVAARRPFLAELGVIARRRSLDPERVAAIYDGSSSLLDRLLLRLVAVHEEASAATREGASERVEA